MLDSKHNESMKANGNIRVLKLHRETLRELDAGELMQAPDARRTEFCPSERACTGGGHTKKC